MIVLTLGEIDAIERKAGVSIKSLADPDQPLAKMMAATYWVVKRRSEPEYKFDDALNLPMDEVADVFTEAFGIGQDDEQEESYSPQRPA